jgi:septation ring formation regulator EzrA
MPEHDIETIMSQLKALEGGQKEMRGDVKELQTAMVGSVDGRQKGFGQQLINVMEAIEKIGTRLNAVEEFKIKTEGAWTGGRIVVAAIAGLIGVIAGIVTVMVAFKH